MIAPYLLSHGMFMDGLIYATVSNNLANGQGSYWDLFFSETFQHHFREHPPLAFWIQSWFYQLFGDSYLVEKIYSAVTSIFTGYLIVVFWKRLTTSIKSAWLPILIWISIPIITQAARNNLLENTMTIFICLAFLFIQNQWRKEKLIWLIPAGVMLFLAFMTKDPVALFLWSAPFLYLLISLKKDYFLFIKASVVLVLSTTIPFLILMSMNQAAYDYFLTYFNHQVIGSIENVQTVSSRFWIVLKLLKELITPLLIISLIFLLTRKQKVNEQIDRKSTLLFILIGLSGVLPIIISLKQSGFYFIGSLPFFAIGLALLIKPKVEWLYDKLNIASIGYKSLTVTVGLALIFGTYSAVKNNGKFGRDEEKLSDINAIAEQVNSKTIITATRELADDWASIGYFYRYHQISLKIGYLGESKFIIQPSSSKPILNSEYEKIDLNLKMFNFYQKTE